jgi:hypothetical protein
MSTAEPQSLNHLITEDHRAVERAFAELERGSLAAEYRKQLMDHITADLVRQFVAKEQLVYPVVRERVAGGDDIVDQQIAEQERAEHTLKQLEDMDPEEIEFQTLTARLISDIRTHIAYQEEALLPRLAAACAPAELADLGRKARITKDAAPTRPHPGSPDRPPANLLIDTGVGIIDKIRDALAGRKV